MSFSKIAVSAALAGLLLAPVGARAGEGLLPDLRLAAVQPAPPPADVDDEPPARSGPSNADLVVRIDRLERLNRELTGQIEELQFKLRRLEEQGRSQPGGRGSATAADPALPPTAAARPVGSGAALPGATPTLPAATTPTEPARLRRGDAFDPAQNPTAPGAPRQLGSAQPSAPIAPGPIGPALGGRDPGEAPN